MPHLTLYDQLGDMPTFGHNSWAGRGSEPVGRRGPESSPKVFPKTRPTVFQKAEPTKTPFSGHVSF